MREATTGGAAAGRGGGRGRGGELRPPVVTAAGGGRSEPARVRATPKPGTRAPPPSTLTYRAPVSLTP